LRKLSLRLPLGSPASRLLAVVAMIDSIGTGLFLAGAAIFYIRFTGLTGSEVGIGLSIAGGVGFATTVPVGILADRVGARGTLVSMQLWRCLAVIGLLFVSDPLSFAAAASMLAIGDCAAPSLTQAVVGEVVGDDGRVQTLAMLRSTRNLGFSLGAILAAPLVASGSPTAFRMVMLGDGASFLVAALILSRVPITRAVARARRTPFLTTLMSFRDWRYGLVAALDSVLTLHATILTFGIPLWLIRATKAPVGLVPVLLLINTAMAVVLQVPLSRRAVTARGAVSALRLAGVMLAGCAVAMALAGRVGLAGAVSGLVLGTVLMSLGEIWQSAGAWEVSYRYAAPGHQAQSLAVFSLGIAAQEVYGPVLITAVVIGAGTAGWLSLAALFGVVTLVIGPASNGLERASRRAGPGRATEPGHRAETSPATT